MKTEIKKNTNTEESIFILISHYSEDVNFELIASTCDYGVFKNALCDYDLECDDEEFNRTGYKDFGFYDDTRYVAYKFMKEIPKNRKLYLLYGNGYDRFSWYGQVIGLYNTMTELKDALAKFADLKFYIDTKKEIREELKSLDTDGYYEDLDITYYRYDILKLPKPKES